MPPGDIPQTINRRGYSRLHFLPNLGHFFFQFVYFAL
jgi:hypothetical protein